MLKLRKKLGVYEPENLPRDLDRLQLWLDTLADEGQHKVMKMGHSRRPNDDYHLAGL